MPRRKKVTRPGRTKLSRAKTVQDQMDASMCSTVSEADTKKEKLVAFLEDFDIQGEFNYSIRVYSIFYPYSSMEGKFQGSVRETFSKGVRD